MESNPHESAVEYYPMILQDGVEYLGETIVSCIGGIITAPSTALQFLPSCTTVAHPSSIGLTVDTNDQNSGSSMGRNNKKVKISSPPNQHR